MTILIADSGSTKTDWILHDKATTRTTLIATSGLNPCLMTDEEITKVLKEELMSALEATKIDHVHFYGAGCRPDQVSRMATLLCSVTEAKEAFVASDLLGAAHALCGHEEGIVAILGTGSGSAVFDGERFVAQTPSLGFILGDEGSGAVLGRRLLGNVFKRQLSATVLKAFDQECGVTIDEAIRRVYREPAPNRYLASFTRFLAAHRDDESIHDMLVNEFREFFVRNIDNYDRPDLCVNIVGSLAVIFEAELRESATLTGHSIGKIMRSPAESILNYYINL